MTYRYWEYGKRSPGLYLKDLQEIIMMIIYVNDEYDAVYNTALSARHRAVLKELFIVNTIKSFPYTLVQREVVQLSYKILDFVEMKGQQCK